MRAAAAPTRYRTRDIGADRRAVHAAEPRVRLFVVANPLKILGPEVAISRAHGVSIPLVWRLIKELRCCR